MTAKAAETQLYNMQNRNSCEPELDAYSNNYNSSYGAYPNSMQNFMSTVTSNEKIIGNKADNAIYRATAAQYMATDLKSQIENIFKSESFIYIIIAIVLVALILVFRTTM